MTTVIFDRPSLAESFVSVCLSTDNGHLIRDLVTNLSRVQDSYASPIEGRKLTLVDIVSSLNKFVKERPAGSSEPFPGFDAMYDAAVPPLLAEMENKTFTKFQISRIIRVAATTGGLELVEKE